LSCAICKMHVKAISLPCISKKRTTKAFFIKSKCYL
jgi:hypothetical protein